MCWVSRLLRFSFVYKAFQSTMEDDFSSSIVAILWPVTQLLEGCYLFIKCAFIFEYQRSSFGRRNSIRAKTAK